MNKMASSKRSKCENGELLTSSYAYFRQAMSLRIADFLIQPSQLIDR